MKRRYGFTLVELLASVGIIVVIMGIIFPVVGLLRNSSRDVAGANTAETAIRAARAWSTASLPQADLGSDPVDAVFGATYSGTAAIFCPANEIRIVINNQRATTDGNPPNVNSNNALESFGRNGYRDYRVANGARTDLAYISIPQGAGIVGISRNQSGPFLVAPPFAVAFDREGKAFQGWRGASSLPVIYYDANFDNAYDTTATRGTASPSYVPADWDADAVGKDSVTGVRPLPFEAIETVAGIIVYNEKDAIAAGVDFVGAGALPGLYPQGSAGYDWLRANGTAYFFSPSSGTLIRDEGQE